MDAGRLRPVVLLTTLALVAAACGAASAEGRPAVPVQADLEDVGAVVSANTGLAIDLFRLVHSDAGATNVVLGPHSISTAMTIVLSGARGSTADELGVALGHTLDTRLLHDTVAALDSSLRARHGGRTRLSLGNRVWLQDDIDVVPEFGVLVSDVYGAGPELVDFRTKSGAAIDDVNAWGSDQTNGTVPEILGGVAAADRLRWIVVNATYFNGDWADEFDAAQTSDRGFSLPSDTSVEVATMAGDFDVSTRSGKGWRSARLPYRDGGLSMIVIVPVDLDAFVAGLDLETWSDAALGFTDSGTDRIEMPKFSARWHGNLVPMFEELGVRDAFGCDADFSGIFQFDHPGDEGDTNIGFIEHEAFIDVDESGTEAAAVTAVGGFQKVSGDLPDDAPFVVDRPFVYAITDDLTGAILFLGSMSDPRVEASEASTPPQVSPRLCG